MRTRTYTILACLSGSNCAHLLRRIICTPVLRQNVVDGAVVPAQPWCLTACVRWRLTRVGAHLPARCVCVLELNARQQLPRETLHVLLVQKTEHSNRTVQSGVQFYLCTCRTRRYAQCNIELLRKSQNCTLVLWPLAPKASQTNMQQN